MILAVCLLGLAYTLRVYGLGRQDLWGDEAVSALVLKHDVVQILNGQVDPLLPPLYFLLLRFCTCLAGRTEFAIRYLSLVGAMVGVAFTGRAARESLGRPAGALALALATIAPFQVYYAQEARMYGVALAFNAGALWAAIAALRQRRLARQKSFWQAWIAFAVLALGAVYAHYISFLHLLGIAASLAIAWRRQARQLALAGLTAVMMGLVYLPWAWGQVNRLGGQFPFRPHVWTLTKLLDITRDTLQAFSVGQTLHQNWGWGIVALMALAAGIGCAAAIRPRRPERWLPGVVVVTVLVGGWAFNAYLFIFESRYLMVGMPAYLLLVAGGIYWVGRRWPALAALSLAAILAAASFANATYYTSYTKGNYGKLMRTVISGAQPGDLLMLNNPLQRAIFEYYRPTNVDYAYISRDAIIDPARLDAEMTRLAAGRGRVWLVMFGDPNEYDPEFQVEHWLATHGAKSHYEGFGDSTLALYVMSSAAGVTVPVSATFDGQMALTGYLLSAGVLRPGDTLIVELDWKAIADPGRDYTIFVQLIGPDGTLVAQVDTPPVGGTRPTSAWAAGESVSDRYALRIPTTAPAGEGQLIVGLYPWPDLTRLPLTETGGLPAANDALRLATITITTTSTTTSTITLD